MPNDQQNEKPWLLSPQKIKKGAKVMGVVTVIYSFFILILFPAIGIIISFSPATLDATKQTAGQEFVTFAYHPSVAIRTAFIIGSFSDIILGVLLLAGAVGLLRLKSWARKLCI